MNISATTIHLATIFPDWSSLESVRRAHSGLEFWALVFFALLVVSEAVAHLSKDEHRKHILDTFGIVFFAIAVLAEIAAYPYGQRNDTLSEQVIGSLDAKAKEAAGNADRAVATSSNALSQANDALTKSGKAEDSLGKAESDAKGAQAASSNALILASSARKEADSFEVDIVSAKKQAADAESHLAEALRQTAAATAELHRIKTPRSLTRAPELVALLKPFSGTEYVFSSVFQDEESIYLVRSIDEALQKAGWKRGKSVAGFPGINVYGADQPDFAVPVGFNIGVQISTESTNPPKPVETRTLGDFPQYVQAAAALNSGLSQCLSPLQDNGVGKLVNVTQGTSTTIHIAVGRKP